MLTDEKLLKQYTGKSLELDSWMDASSILRLAT